MSDANPSVPTREDVARWRDRFGNLVAGSAGDAAALERLAYTAADDYLRRVTALLAEVKRLGSETLVLIKENRGLRERVAELEADNDLPAGHLTVHLRR